ncbi:MAG: hypothetical protein ACI4IQ_07185 [Eubacterium sp.]
MTAKKKTALIFLASINLINIIAGIVTQLTMIFGWDVTSVIPIKAELTVFEVLIVNFSVLFVIMTAINVITAYLATDVPYSFAEIIMNCPGIALTVPVILMFLAVYNAVMADISADRACILISAVVYVFANVINFGCVATIREDAE